MFSDSILVFNNLELKSNSIIGVMASSDCNTCYEILLTRLNALRINTKIENNIYVMVKGYYDVEFINFLKNRYRLQIRISQYFTQSNSIIDKIKTPYLIETGDNGEIERILQINLGNLNYVLSYFDSYRDKILHNN